jgi:hypothetical protein
MPINSIVRKEQNLKKLAINMVKMGYYKQEDYEKFINANHLPEMPRFEEII